MKTLKPTLAVSLATLALALSAGVAPAAAGGYKGWNYGHHKYGHGWYAGGGHHHRHYRRGGYSRSYGGISFVFVQPITPRPVYVAPRPVYVAPRPAAYDCKPTTGTSVAPNGRAALYGGTWCHDGYGRGYVVAGSEYFIRYLN